MPDEAIGCGFHEAVRGVLSHHVVIRDGKIANYHPYPPTPWNASPRDIYGTPGPYEDAVQNTPIFEENGPDKFKGIDIMRAVRSFDPCLPCGVHMYLGNGKTARDASLADVRRQFLRTWKRRGSRWQHKRTFSSALKSIERLIQQIEAAVRPQPAQDGQGPCAGGDGPARDDDSSGCSKSCIAPDEPARRSSTRLARDDLVSSVLVLHGLHPLGLEDRVRRALDKVRRTSGRTAAQSNCSSLKTASFG